MGVLLKQLSQSVLTLGNRDNEKGDSDQKVDTAILFGEQQKEELKRQQICLPYKHSGRTAGRD